MLSRLFNTVRRVVALPLVFGLITFAVIAKKKIVVIHSNSLGILLLHSEMTLREIEFGYHSNIRADHLIWFSAYKEPDKFLATLCKERRGGSNIQNKWLMPAHYPLTKIVNYVRNHPENSFLNKLPVFVHKSGTNALMYDTLDIRQRGPIFLPEPDSLSQFGMRFLKSQGLNLDLPLVVVFVRDSHWYSKFYGKRNFYYRWDHHEGIEGFRNSPLENFVPATNALLNRGLAVIRVGRSKEPFPIKHANFLDYATMGEADGQLDQYFFWRSSLSIVGPSGGAELASMYRKPKILVDIPFPLMPPNDPHTIYLPRLPINKLSGRHESLISVLNRRLPTFALKLDYDNLGLDLDYRSGDEIREATLMALDQINHGGWSTKPPDSQYQFWTEYKKSMPLKFEGPVRSSIAPSLFAKYPRVFAN